MAVPKKRQSSSRSAKRRANHDRVAPANVAACPSCGEPRLAHRVCPSCGKYGGRVIIAQPEDEG
ncbi:MAG: 50S ribosomal protein L32 [Proteobacteria bacterium]|nr:50S ribosomal protein L32 [Pseudomonadota bacterium]